jgi:hypothetical protein
VFDKVALADYVQPPLDFEDAPWADADVLTAGDYYTHPVLVAAARATMGGVDLDPASCREANTVVQADVIYRWEDNGLTQPWAGRVWLNPPFGQWEAWAAKSCTELDSGRVEQMCVFITANAATTKGFHPLLRRADAVFLPEGRYQCWGPKASTSPEGNFIFYFGTEVARFAEAYAPYGTVFEGL